jgi:non-canonical purine NTP pyrophosphatase (RdgB/HAM1 family)
MNLVFVTGNEGKVKEAQAILGQTVKIVKMDIDEVQSLDIEYIVKRKAQDAYKKLQKPLLVDDAGLFIDAWNDFPGALVKFIDLSGGNELLLKMMAGEKNRKAYFMSAVAFHDGKEVKVFIGKIDGSIALEQTGKNGWGYDPIFIPTGEERTFAQMTSDEKNSISHRRRALTKLQYYLKKTGNI